MKRKVSVGKEFELEAIVLSEKREVRTDLVRHVIAYVVLGLSGLFLIGAAITGWSDGTFDELQATWMIAANPIGNVMGFYFKGGYRTTSDVAE
jgi:hypothetical protein